MLMYQEIWNDGGRERLMARLTGPPWPELGKGDACGGGTCVRDGGCVNDGETIMMAMKKGIGFFSHAGKV